MKIKNIIRGAAKVAVVAAAAVTVWKAHVEIDAILENDAASDEDKNVDIAVAMAPVVVVGAAAALALSFSYLVHETSHTAAIAKARGEALQRLLSEIGVDVAFEAVTK